MCVKCTIFNLDVAIQLNLTVFTLAVINGARFLSRWQRVSPPFGSGWLLVRDHFDFVCAPSDISRLCYSIFNFVQLHAHDGVSPRGVYLSYFGEHLDYMNQPRPMIALNISDAPRENNQRAHPCHTIPFLAEEM